MVRNGIVQGSLNGSSFPIQVVDGAFQQAITGLRFDEINHLDVSFSVGEKTFRDRQRIRWKEANELSVILTWEGAVDMDLHVLQPDNSRIFFDNHHPESGGSLSIDNIDGFVDFVTEDRNFNRPEEYTLNSKLGHRVLPGGYQIVVAYYSSNGRAEPVPYTVRIYVNGRAMTPLTGEFTEEKQLKLISEVNL